MSFRQFEVYRNPARKRTGSPYVVILQSNEFAWMPSRVVAPLVPAVELAVIERDHPQVAPLLIVGGAAFRLNPFDIAAIFVDRLTSPVASFADDSEAKRHIQNAIDASLKPF